MLDRAWAASQKIDVAHFPTLKYFLFTLYLLLTYHSIVRWIPKMQRAEGSTLPPSSLRQVRTSSVCLLKAQKWRNSGWHVDYSCPVLRPAHPSTRLRIWREHKKAAYHLFELPENRVIIYLMMSNNAFVSRRC